MAKNLSGRVKKTPPTGVSADRYNYIGLSEVEPDLGVPSTTNQVLTSSVQGIRSWVAATALQGTGGSAGIQGLTGIQGIQGTVGASGVSSSYFNYRTDTNSTSNSDPGSGNLRYNNATQTSTTALYIDHLTQDNIDIDMFLALLQVNDKIFIQDANNSANFQQFKVSGAINPGANTYVQVPVTFVTSGGTGTTGFSNNHPVILVTTAAGIQGTTGSQGTIGTQGTTGIGTQGTTGLQGTTGAQGLTGTQGISGTQGTIGIQGIQGGFSFALGAGVQTFLTTPSSVNLVSAVTDETGSGALVFANTPTLVTPVIGAATGTSLALTGGLTAATKSFDIPHPTKFNTRLRYGSLEGPENGVYIRGNTTENIIELPEYWIGLVDGSTITVSLTPIGSFQKIYIEKVENNKVYIGGKVKEISYIVFGERKDTPKLIVEY
jgi:hypothetical protein